jgi:hypothetical protein
VEDPVVPEGEPPQRVVPGQHSSKFLRSYVADRVVGEVKSSQGLVSRQRLCDDARPLVAKVTRTKAKVAKTLTVQYKLKVRERECERGGKCLSRKKIQDPVGIRTQDLLITSRHSTGGYGISFIESIQDYCYSF